ncbi:MAG: hypothetical protein ICV66_06455 [Chitinophagaceae bacterium]|nr:hypothetical protein [Chitinophagaceae bacterium]
MRSARLMLRRKALCLFSVLFLLFVQISFSQDNSPYSRYGLGDVAPNTNVVNRGMGGISAAYSDFLSINSNNPASYSNFLTKPQANSRKIDYGRVILDAAINYDNRTLRSPNQPEKFTASNIFFSYVQLGIPLRRNWGFSFGLRPLSRVDYKIARREGLHDPITGNFIDSAYTEFSGDGGSFLPSIGTGFAIKNFSAGVNFGYLFGKKQNTTKRSLFNDSDSIFYNSSNYTTRSSFGDIFFNAGAQYKITINKQTFLRLGISGNLERNLKATQDILRETYIPDPTSGDFQLDSVYEKNNIKGEIAYPASYNLGFVVEHQQEKASSWLFGADFIQNKWNNYRFFGSTDSVEDNWQLRVGAQLRPKPAQNYFSNVAYRVGFFAGPEYIKISEELPQYGISFGAGLPIANYNRLAQGQYTIINLAFEYLRRGNSDNRLQENLFRLSIGLNFSDLWFRKKKYD